MEECMISTLLPLAKCHVERCRTLEEQQQQQQKEQENKKEQSDTTVESTARLQQYNDPFVQWTLPPHKAIANLCYSKLFQDKINSDKNMITSKNIGNDHPFLPSSVASKVKTSTNDTSDNNNSITASWCDKHGFSKDFVMTNMDLFQVLIHNHTKDNISWSNSSGNVNDIIDDVKISLAKAIVDNKEDYNDFISLVTQNGENSWPIPEIIMPSYSHEHSSEKS